jgi:acetylornithine deacetylase
MSYSAGDCSWLWKAGIPGVYYGPAGGLFAERGPAGAYTLVSEMVTCAKVLALTALDVCGVAG